MVSSPVSRANFINQSLTYTKLFGFDGIDIDWEYPGYAPREGKPEDTQNFHSFMQELRAAAGPQVVLTIAAPAGPDKIILMEPEKIEPYLDFFNVMTYDIHGPWENVTGATAPLIEQTPGDGLSVTSAIEDYLARKVPSTKLLMGLPLYGDTFDVSGQKAPYPIGTPAKGPGAKGRCTQALGQLAYYDIIALTKESGSTNIYNQTIDVNEAWSASGNEWVGYDDVQSLLKKVAYLKQANLGGAMFWSLELDDFPNGFPLITAVSNALGP